ncbi:hypothetical protein RCS94_07105 [Orbaceae bacterium ac157xtp]
MTWPKPEVELFKLPKAPLLWVWMVGFGVTFIITAITLVLNWSDDNYLSSATFWLLLIFIPVLIVGFALSVRAYQHGLSLQRYTIWQQEQDKIDQNWQNWAMNYADIVSSYWVTPNELSSIKILFDGQNLPIQHNKILEFDRDGFEYERYFTALFYNFVDEINTLPNHINIAITIYSSTESYDGLDEVVQRVCQNCKVKNSYTISHKTTPYVQLEKINDLIDYSQDEMQILIINNLFSKESAFLVGLLLIDEEYSQQIEKLRIGSHLLRPMVTTDLPAAIKQMAKMQPAIKEVSQLWCANLDKAQEVTIAKLLSESGISPENINFLDSIAGKQSDLAYWALLALGNQLVMQTQENILLVTKSQDKFLFTVLTSQELG